MLPGQQHSTLQRQPLPGSREMLMYYRGPGRNENTPMPGSLPHPVLPFSSGFSQQHGMSMHSFPSVSAVAAPFSHNLAPAPPSPADAAAAWDQLMRMYSHEVPSSAPQPSFTPPAFLPSSNSNAFGTTKCSFSVAERSIFQGAKPACSPLMPSIPAGPTTSMIPLPPGFPQLSPQFAASVPMSMMYPHQPITAATGAIVTKEPPAVAEATCVPKRSRGASEDFSVVSSTDEPSDSLPIEPNRIPLFYVSGNSKMLYTGSIDLPYPVSVLRWELLAPVEHYPESPEAIPLTWEHLQWSLHSDKTLLFWFCPKTVFSLMPTIFKNRNLARSANFRLVAIHSAGKLEIEVTGVKCRLNDKHLKMLFNREKSLSCDFDMHLQQTNQLLYSAPLESTPHQLPPAQAMLIDPQFFPKILSVDPTIDTGLRGDHATLSVDCQSIPSLASTLKDSTWRPCYAICIDQAGLPRGQVISMKHVAKQQQAKTGCYVFGCTGTVTNRTQKKRFMLNRETRGKSAGHAFTNKVRLLATFIENSLAFLITPDLYKSNMMNSGDVFDLHVVPFGSNAVFNLVGLSCAKKSTSAYWDTQDVYRPFSQLEIPPQIGVCTMYAGVNANNQQSKFRPYEEDDKLPHRFLTSITEFTHTLQVTFVSNGATFHHALDGARGDSPGRHSDDTPSKSEREDTPGRRHGQGARPRKRKETAPSADADQLPTNKRQMVGHPAHSAFTRKSTAPILLKQPDPFCDTSSWSGDHSRSLTSSPEAPGLLECDTKEPFSPIADPSAGLAPSDSPSQPHMVKVLVHKSTGALVLPQSSYPRPLTHEPTSEPPSAPQIVQDLPNLDTVDSSMEGEIDVEELDKWNFPMEEADAFLTDEFASDVNRAADDEDFFTPGLEVSNFFLDVV